MDEFGEKKIIVEFASKKTSKKYAHTKYLFQQISKFLEYSMGVFYGIRTLKSIDYSKNNWF